MNHSDLGLAAARVMTLTLAAALPLATQAQAAADKWEWGATVYGWFPAIGGSSEFPTSGGGSSIDVTTSEVVDALKFAFMGTLEGRKGQWGFWTDLVYADFGAGKSGTREVHVGPVQLPVGVTANLDLDIKSWIWTAAGTYRLGAGPAGTMDLLAGARMLDMQQSLIWSFNGDISGLPLPGPSGTSQIDETQWNVVAGIKGRANLGAEGKWFIPYYVDVGTGQSKFTWQGIAGVGYDFKWGSVLAAWRYMGYDFKSGQALQTLNFSGPAVGVAFRW